MPRLNMRSPELRPAPLRHSPHLRKYDKRAGTHQEITGGSAGRLRKTAENNNPEAPGAALAAPDIRRVPFLT